MHFGLLGKQIYEDWHEVLKLVNITPAYEDLKTFRTGLLHLEGKNENIKTIKEPTTGKVEEMLQDYLKIAIENANSSKPKNLLFGVYYSGHGFSIAVDE